MNEETKRGDIFSERDREDFEKCAQVSADYVNPLVGMVLGSGIGLAANAIRPSDPDENHFARGAVSALGGALMGGLAGHGLNQLRKASPLLQDDKPKGISKLDPSWQTAVGLGALGYGATPRLGGAFMNAMLSSRNLGDRANIVGTAAEKAFQAAKVSKLKQILTLGLSSSANKQYRTASNALRRALSSNKAVLSSLRSVGAIGTRSGAKAISNAFGSNNGMLLNVANTLAKGGGRFGTLARIGTALAGAGLLGSRIHYNLTKKSSDSERDAKLKKVLLEKVAQMIPKGADPRAKEYGLSKATRDNIYRNTRADMLREADRARAGSSGFRWQGWRDPLTGHLRMPVSWGSTRRNEVNTSMTPTQANFVSLLTKNRKLRNHKDLTSAIDKGVSGLDFMGDPSVVNLHRGTLTRHGKNDLAFAFKHVFGHDPNDHEMELLNQRMNNLLGTNAGTNGNPYRFEHYLPRNI